MIHSALLAYKKEQEEELLKTLYKQQLKCYQELIQLRMDKNPIESKKRGFHANLPGCIISDS